MHPAADPRPVLFEMTALTRGTGYRTQGQYQQPPSGSWPHPFQHPPAPAPAPAAPTPAPCAPTGYNQAPNMCPSDRKSGKKGEQKPPAIPTQTEAASTPLLHWKQPAKTKTLGLLLKNLKEQDSTLVIPSLTTLSSSSPSRKKVCFPFTTEPNQHGTTGCTGQHRANRATLIKCDRHHVDLSHDAWKNCSKDDLRPLWDFIHLPLVSEHLVPTEAFTAFMS